MKKTNMSPKESKWIICFYSSLSLLVSLRSVGAILFDVTFDVRSTVGVTLETTSTLSASQCAFYCVIRSDCAGFNFAKTDSGDRKSCELRDTPISDASHSVPDVNFNYYGRSITAACPAGWVQDGASCYQFFSTNTNWATSKSNCEALGAHLVTLDTLDEQTFMEDNYVMPYIRPNTYHAQIWVGGEYISGVFRWVTTLDPVEPSWPFWGSRGAYSTSVGTCLAYSVNDLFYCQLYDYNCAYARPYLCEYDL